MTFGLFKNISFRKSGSVKMYVLPSKLLKDKGRESVGLPAS